MLPPGKVACPHFGHGLKGQHSWFPARNWDGPAERKTVRDSLPNSYERLFHESGGGDFFLEFTQQNDAVDVLSEQRLERAIGVIYRPETERQSHYFKACLPRQFDGVFHLDTTHAVEPLERAHDRDRGETPETFPRGL
jgi:erythromycin esterase-like protein